MRKLFGPILILCLLILSLNVLGQSNLLKKEKEKYILETRQRIERDVKNRSKARERYLKKFNRSQEKFLRKLCKIDCAMADAQYKFWGRNHNKLLSRLNSPKQGGALGQIQNKVYDSHSDSLYRSVEYLGGDSSTDLINQSKSQEYEEKLVHDYMLQQRDIMKKISNRYPRLKDDYLDLSKESYYFTQRLNDIKNELLKKSKLDFDVLNGLVKDPGFAAHFQSNSSIAGINKIPQNWGNDIMGLQTQTIVKELQNLDLKTLKGDALDAVKENTKDGVEKIQEMKSDFPQLSCANDIPDFKPNPLKTKSFGSRLKFGLDFQFKHADDVLPVGFIGGGSVSYQLSKKSSFGIGLLSQKDFKAIKDEKKHNFDLVTIRSELETKLRGLIFLGVNYERLYDLPKFEIANRNSDSFLAGLIIKYKMKTFAGFQISFLYDFLYEKHQPVGQPLIYRIGYKF